MPAFVPRLLPASAAAAWAVKPLNMEEAATALGVSRRTLTDALRTFPHYELRGRKKVFYPEHIRSLRKDMNECASRSSGSTDGLMPTELPLAVRESDALSKLRILAKQKRPARA